MANTYDPSGAVAAKEIMDKYQGLIAPSVSPTMSELSQAAAKKYNHALEAAPLTEAFIETHRCMDALQRQLSELARRVEKMAAERARVVRILAAFRSAPISISSLQPLLDLADELSPMKAER